MARRTQTTALIGSETSAPWSSVFDEADATRRHPTPRRSRRAVPALAATVLATVLMVGLSSAPSSAMGTAEDRAACIPDAFRLCSAAIPDADRVIACLKTERVKLSTACRVAMRRNGAI